MANPFRADADGDAVDVDLVQRVQNGDRSALEQLVLRHEGNVREAARAAGVDRVYLYRLLWKYGLKRRGNDS